MMFKIPSYSRDRRVDDSLDHSIKDGVFFAIMGGVSESYLSAFAVALKATAPQIAMLATVPPLIASSLQLFAVWLGQTTGVRKNIIVIGALIQTAALVMIGVLPLLFPTYAFPVLLLCLCLYFGGANLGSPLWGSLMGSLVPEQVRGRFFATRTRLSSIASFCALLAGGFILQGFNLLGLTMVGFAAIFLIGVLSRLASAWHLSKLWDPPHEHAIPGEINSLFHRGFFAGQRSMLRFSAFFACMQFAVGVSGPFVVVYLLRDLHFSYLQLTFNTAASVLVQFLVLNRWGRLADIFGNRVILRVTGFSIPVVPVLWVLSTDFWYLLLVQAFSGLIWSGFSLSASNYVYDLTTQRKRAGLMAIHAVASTALVFMGAALGSGLALVLPTSISWGPIQFEWLTVFYGIFLISAALRLAVAFVFLRKLQEFRDVRHISHRGLIFRVTRFSPISGVMFDIIGRRSRGPRRDKGDPAANDDDIDGPSPEP